MTEQEFKRLMAEAKRIGGDYGAGYQRGLRRHYHGEKFGEPGEHELWVSLDGSRQAQGDGYRDGVAGRAPARSGGPVPTTERVAQYEARLAESGGRKLNGIRLNPEAAAVLAEIEAGGESATAAINRLLISAGFTA